MKRKTRSILTGAGVVEQLEVNERWNKRVGALTLEAVPATLCANRQDVHGLREREGKFVPNNHLAQVDEIEPVNCHYCPQKRVLIYIYMYKINMSSS